ncbi:MAG TPA: phosphatidylserine decarboxylase [Candidatus Acidoferrales bacterium]|nr:phosphatidylserine decarboxylase [Candidatus Acidoferrales bacterium]
MTQARTRLERTPHQYVRRGDARVVTERLLGDWLVNFLYAHAREHTGTLFRALTSPRVSKLLAYANFDSALTARLVGHRRFLRACRVNLRECLDPPESFDTPRQLFERKIRYWECRPMADDPDAVLSPADARVLIGSFRSGSPLFIKGKFFEFEELLGRNKTTWLNAFRDGDWAICRLTPDRYHYNHTPVAGEVVDFYQIPGGYHACNPGAVVELVTPYSKNKRVVTVIQTDVPGGTRIGLVAMIEVVALMIGAVVQCYSAERYDAPQLVRTGLCVRKGVPKSLYRPGSSTDVLVFQRDRVTFADDLVRNLSRAGVHSRFSLGFGTPLVETDVKVRSPIARRAVKEGGSRWKTYFSSWRSERAPHYS